MSLPDAAGATQALSQWKGKNLLVNFWAPWCPPCVQEMPELSEVQGEFAAKNLQIIGIGIDSASNIKTFAEKVKIAYPVYVSGMSGTDLSRHFGNATGGLPFYRADRRRWRSQEDLSGPPEIRSIARRPGQIVNSTACFFLLPMRIFGGKMRNFR